MLNDPAGEARWGFKLADALRRAKNAERKILTGYTLYITKSVMPKFDVLQRVTESAGGKVKNYAVLGCCEADNSFGVFVGSASHSSSLTPVLWKEYASHLM